MVADLAALVRIPSVTGQERAALEWLVRRAGELGLHAELVTHDLAAVRADPGYPGEEAPRSELLGVEVRLPHAVAAPRLALCAHVDVVPAGAGAWADEPFSGTVRDGFLYGRGSVDMKAGLIAALHALAAVAADPRPPAYDPVLLAVSSEEDGGLGAFAALRRDAAFDACVITEPTAFDVVCAHAGALTFNGTVTGRAAHAAYRLEGASAIDAYLPIHAALHALERRLNTDVEHPLMRELELPYPVNVGRLSAGDWSSTVPDLLTFAGRAPVRVGESVDDARAAVVAAVGDRARIAWTGGQFASADTPLDHSLVTLVRDAVAVERGAEPRLTGVPWGADMRHFTAHGIPTVMVGPSGIERAHGVDERVSIAELEQLTRILERICRGG